MEIIAVCSQIHTKHINTLFGLNVELLNVKLAVHIVTTGLWSVKYCCIIHNARGSLEIPSLCDTSRANETVLVKFDNGAILPTVDMFHRLLRIAQHIAHFI